MVSKLRIKMGHIEFEYEGDAQFDTSSIKDLFSHLESLVGVTPAAAFDTSPSDPAQADEATGQASNLNLSAGTVAARLTVNSGPDLALAAAAYLQLVQGQLSFKRTDLLTTMKSAKSYYKANMGGNLSKIIQTLVGNGRMNELSSSEYSLTAAEQNTLGVRLALE